MDDLLCSGLETVFHHRLIGVIGVFLLEFKVPLFISGLLRPFFSIYNKSVRITN